MKKHHFTRVGDTLMPLDLEARQALHKLPFGEIRAVQFHHVRNVANHNRLLALCQLIIGSTERFNEVDEVLDELALLAGFYRTHHCTDGKSTRIPHSIAFERLDEDGFRGIWQAYKRVTAKWILPQLDEEGVDSGVRRELNRMMAQPLRRARA